MNATTTTQTTSTKTNEQKAQEKATKATNKAKENATKYGADATTLRWDELHGKFSVEIRCARCGAVRRVFTSDLFQVLLCADCTKAARKEHRKEQKAAAKVSANTAPDVSTDVDAFVAQIADVA